MSKKDINNQAHNRLTNLIVLSYMRIKRGFMATSTEGKGVLVARGRGFKRVKLHLKYSKVPFAVLRGSYFDSNQDKVAKYVKRYKRRASNWFINLHVPKYLLQRYMLLDTCSNKNSNTLVDTSNRYLSNVEDKDNIVTVKRQSKELNSKIFKNTYLNRSNTKKILGNSKKRNKKA